LFEKKFAEFCHRKYALGVSSGTVALSISLAALGVGPGQEVLVPGYFWVSTVGAIVRAGAIPVLVDIDETFCMDPKDLQKKIVPKTSLILVVHMSGVPGRLDEICRIASDNNLKVLADCAQANGSTFKGKPIGTFGDMAIFSLQLNKILTTGEGGMVMTNHPELARVIRSLKDVAFSEERHFWHKRLGYNFRMTNLAAAVGLAQTERFETLVETHRRNAVLYKERLSYLPGVTTAPEAPWAKNVYWMFGILLDVEQFGMTRDELRAFLAMQGIETRTFFVPIHFQPYYFSRYAGQRFPVAERLGRDGMYLPSSSLLAPEEIDYVCDAIKKAHESAV